MTIQRSRRTAAPTSSSPQSENAMTNKLSFALLGLVIAIAIATPADAAHKEQLQMMADIRMLQEQSQQQTRARPPLAANADSAARAAAPAGATPGAPPLPVGMSPQKLYDSAYSDFVSAQYDLAIQGFDMYIKSFPKSDMADDAQVN